MISKIRPYLNARSPFQKILLSFLMGLLSVGALAPFHLWPLAFIAFSVFFILLDQGACKRDIFLIGWAFGIGFFGAGLYWLTHAFLVNSNQHAWMIPIALPLLALFVGLFIAASASLSRKIGQWIDQDAQVLGRILIFSCCWMILEWVRSWIFTGFPWNMMGTIWGGSDVMLQNAALFGAFGFSFITVFCATLPAALLYFTGPKRVILAFLPCLVLLSLYEYGAWRLSGAKTENHDAILLRLVQPNIAQRDKWKADKKVENFKTLFNLSITQNLPPDQRPSHIIWPETAVTFPVNRDANVKQALAQLAPTGGSIIVGSPLASPAGEKPFQIWNSLIALDETAQTLGRYDKSHLVPFGEYMPYRDLLPIEKITAGKVDFSKGSGLETLNLPGLPPFSPLICYEIIFPGKVIEQNNRPAWLLNLTNDGWYGDTPGPYQHALSSRMRSIEEGLPLVRVANTGITLITDAYGRVQDEIPYGVQGHLDVPLARPLADRPLGATYANQIILFLCLITFAIVGLLHRRKT